MEGNMKEIVQVSELVYSCCFSKSVHMQNKSLYKVKENVISAWEFFSPSWL